MSSAKIPPNPTRNAAKVGRIFGISIKKPKKRVSGKSMWVGINHRKPVEEEFFVHNAP